MIFVYIKYNNIYCARDLPRQGPAGEVSVNICLPLRAPGRLYCGLITPVKLPR